MNNLTEWLSVVILAFVAGYLCKYSMRVASLCCGSFVER